METAQERGARILKEFAEWWRESEKDASPEEKTKRREEFKALWLSSLK